MTIAPSFGVFRVFSPKWFFRADLSVGFMYYDNTWHTQRGPLLGFSLGTEYLVTRFLSLNISASTETAFFSRWRDYYYDSGFSGINRLNLVGGVRFYF